jgi:cysteinyl-tRNA synthetase
VNITDIGHLSSDSDEGEDKMTKGLKREGMPLTLDSMKQLAEKYAAVYIEDRKKLNILEPTHLPFASEHINESINMIESLVFKGFAYKTEDGVYFDTVKIQTTANTSYGNQCGECEETE